jgi:hypothetical protein
MSVQGEAGIFMKGENSVGAVTLERLAQLLLFLKEELSQRSIQRKLIEENYLVA